MDLEPIVIELRKGLSDARLNELCRILGFQFSGWLRLLAQNMLYSDITGSMMEVDTYSPKCVTAAPEYDNDLLVLSEKGVPAVGVPFVTQEVWPFEPAITVQYSDGEHLIATFGSHYYTITCRKDGNRLIVDWPEELNIVGDIDLSSRPYQEGFTAKFLTGSTYPAEQVVSMLTTSGVIFNLPDKYISSVVNVGTPLDSLAILTYAVYKTLHG